MSVKIKIKRDFVAISNMRPALKQAIRQTGETARPPKSMSVVVHELLEREFGALADKIERGR